jgi:hypothetical protein
MRLSRDSIWILHVLSVLALKSRCQAFSISRSTSISRRSTSILHLEDNEWTSDFDDFIQGGGDDDGDAMQISSIFKARGKRDLSAIQTRQFYLGEDLVLADFVGNMGFDEVTDWEYYYENEEDPTDRNVVQPNPFDSEKPKRTRKSSGSVVSVTFPMCLFLITNLLPTAKNEFIFAIVALVDRFEYSVVNLWGD